MQGMSREHPNILKTLLEYPLITFSTRRKLDTSEHTKCDCHASLKYFLNFDYSIHVH